jgi:hypothetical protein
MAGRGDDDDFTEDHQTLITAALDVLNEFGRPARDFLRHELAKEENSEAEAWIAGLWDLTTETKH